MEYRYYRELKHNYLIVKEEDNTREKMASYQARILEKGKLSGFIPCNMRVINNENYLYYEINSMQSLHDRFAVKGMDAQQFTKLLRSMKVSLESLSEYLLGMENVVLDARSVFVDLATGDYKFMYCPFKQEQADFAGFVEELVELVDHEDEAAVEMVYACSEMAQVESVLALDCIDQLLERENEVERSGGYKDDSQNTQEILDFDESSFDYDEDDTEDEEEIPDGHKKLEKRLGGKAQLIFGFLFMGLLAAMMYIRMNYVLTREENILSIIVIVLAMVTGLVALITGVKDFRSSFAGKKQKEKSAETDEDEKLDYLADDIYEEMMDPEESAMDIDSYRNKVKVTSYDRKPIVTRAKLPSCAETMVLTEDDDYEKDITLYSRNADKTIRIPLSRLPLTVGKMAGCVDKVIEDMSISRIHCRFMEDEDNRLFVVDLGSTNGTFKNGIKLIPQEKNYIGEGDEIRIGRICFDCR